MPCVTEAGEGDSQRGVKGSPWAKRSRDLQLSKADGTPMVITTPSPELANKHSQDQDPEGNAHEMLEASGGRKTGGQMVIGLAFQSFMRC